MNSYDVFHYLIEGPWVVFVAYWVVTGLKTRATVRQESFASRYGVLALEIAGFVLLFSQNASVGVLALHIFPRTMAGAVVGTILTWAGIGLALWARFHLGQYWSARITLKEDHQLIRTGPYTRLRHPIYTGLDLAVVGTAVVIDYWRCARGRVPDHAGIHNQSPAGGTPAGGAIRGGVRGTPQARRIFAAAVVIPQN